MSPEQLELILFAFAVPVVVQALKLVADKLGKPIPTWVVQLIAVALSAGFVYLNGEFAGIEFPVYSGDPLAFVGSLVALVLAAWGPVELTYRLLLKALFEKLSFA